MEVDAFSFVSIVFEAFLRLLACAVKQFGVTVAQIGAMTSQLLPGTLLAGVLIF